MRSFLVLFLSLALLPSCTSPMTGVDAGTDAPAVDAPIAVDAPVAVDAPIAVDAPAALDAPAAPDAPTMNTDAGTPEVCGGRSGPCESPSTTFCDFPADGCDYADGTGICRPRPEICSRELAPVCGCDGVTYDNLCTAQAAGVDAASTGACAP